jgi:hypothetical protein
MWAGPHKRALSRLTVSRYRKPIPRHAADLAVAGVAVVAVAAAAVHRKVAPPSEPLSDFC